MNGSFYKKQTLLLNTDGSYGISETSKSRLVFDPGHPDALRTGSKKGYVEFPDITLEEELFILKSHILLYNSLVSFLSKEKGVIIHEENFESYVSILNLMQRKRYDEVFLQLETLKMKK
ncbi:flagellar biosynthesis protein FlgC [Leptospira adleri]|nr:flagellar biosynthesis protein FlgC [Leptospira adleri]